MDAGKAHFVPPSLCMDINVGLFCVFWVLYAFLIGRVKVHRSGCGPPIKFRLILDSCSIFAQLRCCGFVSSLIQSVLDLKLKI